MTRWEIACGMLQNTMDRKGRETIYFLPIKYCLIPLNVHRMGTCSDFTWAFSKRTMPSNRSVTQQGAAWYSFRILQRKEELTPYCTVYSHFPWPFIYLLLPVLWASLPYLSKLCWHLASQSPCLCLNWVDVCHWSMLASSAVPHQPE